MEREYVGIDLHRRRSVIVRKNASGELLSKTHIDNDPLALAAAVAAAGPEPEVVVEATFGWYWATDLLTEMGCRVHLAHPLGNDWGKRRVKNDERDANDLVDLLRLGRLAEAWIAPPELRELREMVRYRHKLMRLRSGLKAQVHAVMGKHGVLPARVDMFGPGGTAQLDGLELPAGYACRLDSLRIYSADRQRVATSMRIRPVAKVSFQPSLTQSSTRKLAPKSPGRSEISLLPELAQPRLIPKDWRVCRIGFPLTSQVPSPTRTVPFEFEGKDYWPGGARRNRHWSLDPVNSMPKLVEQGRIYATPESIQGIVHLDELPGSELGNVWLDTGTGGFTQEQLYVVQTSEKVVERCILLTTDAGDLVLDPTCGSGTTAYAAEKWGRRWITLDTSRVPLALARQRILTATFPTSDYGTCREVLRAALQHQSSHRVPHQEHLLGLHRRHETSNATSNSAKSLPFSETMRTRQRTRSSPRRDHA